MSTTQSMNQWRAFAEGMVNSLRGVAEKVRRMKEASDSDFPSWRAQRDAAPQDYLTHDARREFYVTAITVLENTQLSFSLLRDQLTDLSWWKAKVEAVSDEKRMSVIKEFVLMVKWFTFHTLAMAVDETLGAIRRAAPNVFHICRHPTLKKIYTKILEVTGKQELKPFLDVL